MRSNCRLKWNTANSIAVMCNCLRALQFSSFMKWWQARTVLAWPYNQASPRRNLPTSTATVTNVKLCLFAASLRWKLMKRGGREKYTTFTTFNYKANIQFRLARVSVTCMWISKCQMPAPKWNTQKKVTRPISATDITDRTITLEYYFFFLRQYYMKLQNLAIG